MSGFAVTITEAQIFQSLGDFISSVLDSSVDVSRGQQNRKAEPSADNYVVMWPLNRNRLSTNVETLVDVAFVGSIVPAGSGPNPVLTVSQMLAGTVQQGLTLTGPGVSSDATIGAQLAGGTPGGAGTYALNTAQPSTTVGSTILQAGYEQYMKPTQVDVQVDVHGPLSADNAEIIATLFRSSFGVEAFAAEGAAIGINFAVGISAIGAVDVVPLYVEDPRQMPFLNAEQQYEERWIVEVHMQANIAVRVPRQFASALSLSVNRVS